MGQRERQKKNGAKEVRVAQSDKRMGWHKKNAKKQEGTVHSGIPPQKFSGKRERVASQAEPADAASSNAKKDGSWRSAIVCRHFKLGKYDRGNSCRFRHT